jgi:3-phytase
LRVLGRSAIVSTLLAALTGCAGLKPAPAGGAPPQTFSKLTLVGQVSIPPLGRYPPSIGLPFGGISGLAMSPDGTLLGISDAQRGGRIYRFTIEGLDGSLRITPTEVIPLETSAPEAVSDHEALVALENMNFLIASEGTGREPRRPPSIDEYERHGTYLRRLPLRDRYVPEPKGPVTRGARGNAGFESLTLTPDRSRLFTGTETALIQDGPTATFAAGTQTRILEYEAHDGTFRPAREFAYNLEPVETPSFKPGVFINGLVELLALNRTTLLALERGYVEDEAKSGLSMNRIRIYRVSLESVSDISSLESLKGHPDVVPAAKTLLLDLATVNGLSPDLAPSLDNFEGMTLGPRLPDGRASLILVSDDNFRESQRTWFLVFAIE